MLTASHDNAGNAAADLLQVIAKWRHAAAQQAGERFSSGPWFRTSEPEAFAADCVTRAGKLAAEGEQSGADSTRIAHFCLVAKRPHIGDRESVVALASRLLAFGVEIGEIRELAVSGDSVAEVLYPAAYRHFADLPASQTSWDALAEYFDNERYEAVFGEPYAPKNVICGAQVIADYGLTAAELTDLWEEGREPISGRVLAERYGSAAASLVLAGGDPYAWFRGEWPLGIHRISSGLMAFAMRHERIADGRPVIILNGHFPGLADLFRQGVAVIAAGLPADGPSIDEVRRWVVGHDNRPAACLPGTIRRDAADGSFRCDSPVPVDSRRNLVHCSDGLLAGMIECQALLRRETLGGALAHRLRGLGLTPEELGMLVAADPLVRVSGKEYRLTELTQGQSLDQCVETIGRVVPPVFGEANGFSSGLTLQSLDRQLARLAEHGGDTTSYSYREPRVRALGEPAIWPGQLSEGVEQAGIDVIRAGGVAFIVPAAGTGGRFGGYDLPEADPSRQKALVPAFSAGGAARSSLDIRLANAAYWRRLTGGRLPVAVMAGPTNVELVNEWRAVRQAAGADDLSVYQQYGTYRVQADLFHQPREACGQRWMDKILRFDDGRPDLKPPGNLGMLTCLALGGMLGTWSADGVEFLVIANGDDVGFRLEPKALGLLRDNPSVDAVVRAAAWGLRGHLLTDQGRLELWGDVSGWCVTADGATGRLERMPSGEWHVAVGNHQGVLQAPVYDVGGSVCDRWTGSDWRPVIAEVTDLSAFSDFPLLSTNQIYLRISSVQRVLGLSAGIDTVVAISRYIESAPFYAERKTVSRGDGRQETVQLSQGANDILRHMSVAPMMLSRSGSAGSAERSAYAVLKRPEDVVPAQAILDRMAITGDSLLFD